MVVWAVPLLTMNLITHCLSARKYFNGIRSLTRFGMVIHHPYRTSALPPQSFYLTLYLNTFRGERASSRFDWHFTPNHNSSNSFSTLISSVLHAILLALQPGHG